MNDKEMVNKLTAFNIKMEEVIRKAERKHALTGLDAEDFVMFATELFPHNTILWLEQHSELNDSLRKSFIKRWNMISRMDREVLINSIMTGEKK